MVFILSKRRPPISTHTDSLFPYTTLFRSESSAIVCIDQVLDAVPVECQAQARRPVLVADVGLDVSRLLGFQIWVALKAKGIERVVQRSEERRVGKESGSTCRSRWSR